LTYHGIPQCGEHFLRAVGISGYKEENKRERGRTVEVLMCHYAIKSNK